jgi:HPt (histidine-containing phosphotransfer) domain-containing protein
MDGDQELLHEVIDIFLSDIEGCLAKVRAEAAKGDVTALQRAVHTVKGAVSNFSSPVATEVAQRMELLCKEGGLEAAIRLMGELEAAVRALAQALERHRGGNREAA